MKPMIDPLDPNDPMMSVKEVAAIFDVTPDTVRIWIKTGRLQACKPGRDYRTKRSWVQEFAGQKYNIDSKEAS